MMNQSTRKLFGAIFACIAFFGITAKVFAFEHPRYDIEATIDTKANTITASEAITFTNNSLSSTDELYFHVYPNRSYTKQEKDFMLRYAGYFKVNPFPEGFDTGKMEIRSITHNQENLDFAFEGKDQTLLRVLLKRKLNPSESIVVKIDFSARIPHAYGRFGWHKNILALSRWYPILSVLGQDGWNKNPFYPFHRPFFSDAAFYSLELTIPNDYVIAHSGEYKEEKSTDKGMKILTMDTPLPIREFTFALSKDYKICEETLEGVSVKSFYLAGDEARAREALKDAKDVLSYYTKRFGAYPYKEFSIVPVFLGYGGEQMSNMIFIDTRVFKLPKILKRHFDFLITHETGHQWFYNIVGMNDFNELWLEEGINSYFNLGYLEDKYGPEANVIEWPKYLDWLLPNFSFRRGGTYRYNLIARTKLNYPIESRLSSYAEPSSIFSITYGKGSRIVSMLRDVLGQESFDRVFERVFSEFRFKNLRTADFIRLCQEESKQDLTWFFSQWLNSTDNCDYAVSKVSRNMVTLKNRGRIQMPVEAEIFYKDGSKQEVAWDGQSQSKEIPIPENRSVKKVILDPQAKLLDIDRVNNIYPRTIHVKPVFLYTPLYDIPITLPDDGYNLVFGPEIGASGLGTKFSFQKPYDQIVYAATGYEFNDKLHKSRLGYEFKNVFHSQTALGVEVFNTTDHEDGDDDLAGGKVYLRKELYPAAYGLSDINDHVTFYLIRNRSLKQGLSLSDAEDSRNTSYLKKDEAIVGGILHFGRLGPYPDPVKGYKIDTLLESSGHFLGATQYFYRGAVDTAFYHPPTPKTKIALRLKYGWGFPDDKNLYELGGWDGLRGYDQKALRGSHLALGSLEFRFPIKEDLGLSFFDNILRLDDIGGVVFMDLGQSWFDDIDETTLRKDAGFGLRLTVSLASFLEKVIIRTDIAQPINDSGEDTHVWFGINHAF